MKDENVSKNQQALELDNNEEKVKKDKGKPNRLKWLSIAVTWFFRIERIISWFDGSGDDG